MAKKKVSKSLLKDLFKIDFHKFLLKDMLQVIIGASILAVPVGFTEETWRLGSTLPTINIMGFLLLSIFFISTFTFYHYFRHNTTLTNHHWKEFWKRVLSTYVLSFFVVTALLILIDKAPWLTEPLVAFNRTIIVTFPSSMSAAVADTLK